MKAAKVLKRLRKLALEAAFVLSIAEDYDDCPLHVYDLLEQLSFRADKVYRKAAKEAKAAKAE